MNKTNTDGKKLAYITTSNLYWNRFELNSLKEMYFTDAEIEKCTVQKGDLLVCEGGDIGRAAIWNFEKEIRIQNHIHRLRPYINLNINFYYYIFYYYKLINLISGKGIGIQGLSSNQLHSILVPLPPILEQNRIVSIIGKKFEIINYLENENEDLLTTIEKTKSKILDLAIRGKLVPQDPNDEPASVLLEKIRAEKENLIKEGKIKRDKRESVIYKGDDNSYFEVIGSKTTNITSEIPFELPKSWRFERLKNIFIINPKNNISDDTEVSFIPMALIEDMYSGKYSYEIKKWKECKNGFTHFAKDDIIFAKISPCFENLKSTYLQTLENGYGAGTTELYVLRRYTKEINPLFLLFFIKSKYFINIGKETFKGVVGQQRVKKEMLFEIMFPIPPLTEQKRIADKVAELFSILDKITENLG
ncbi:MAG: restriction endonuclease subunit S [Firmicutes bacterium]|nr:restriction endonuclease subunit S [Bacillota bacterium]